MWAPQAVRLTHARIWKGVETGEDAPSTERVQVTSSDAMTLAPAGLHDSARMGTVPPSASLRHRQPGQLARAQQRASIIGSVSLPVNVFCWLGW